MYPDDRVLVGVINRKRDLLYAQQDHWYRIPAAKMPRGIYTEYIAFFLSGSAIYKKPSGIYYFARKRGVELVHRTDLLPKEPHHKNAKEIYYKIQFDEVLTKDPIVLNKTGRVISFIYTTWDRFINAEQIRDLYNKSDYYVDRIYHALLISEFARNVTGNQKRNKQVTMHNCESHAKRAKLLLQLTKILMVSIWMKQNQKIKS